MGDCLLRDLRCAPPASTGRARPASVQVWSLSPHLHTSWATEGVYEYIPKLQPFLQLSFILVLSIRNLLHPSAGPPPASSKTFNLLEDYVEELPPTRHGAELVPLPSHGHALCAIVQCGLLMSRYCMGASFTLLCIALQGSL